MKKLTKEDKRMLLKEWLIKGVSIPEIREAHGIEQSVSTLYWHTQAGLSQLIRENSKELSEMIDNLSLKGK